VDEPRKLVLQFQVAQHAALTDQECGNFREVRTTADGVADGVHHVIAVYERLAGGDVAGKQVALQAPFVDALHLVRKRRYPAVLVVHAGDAEHRVRNSPVMMFDGFFSLELRLRVLPGRSERRVFRDGYARPRRLVHEHRTRIEKLFDLEVLQAVEQATRAIHIDLLVEGVVLTGKIEVGGEMYDRRQMRAEAFADVPEDRGNRFVRAQVNRKAAVGRFAIEVHADDAEFLFQSR